MEREDESDRTGEHERQEMEDMADPERESTLEQRGGVGGHQRRQEKLHRLEEMPRPSARQAERPHQHRMGGV